MDDANPYASPAAVEATIGADALVSGGGSWGQVGRWCVAYAVNMPFPFYCGYSDAESDEFRVASMLAGIALLMAVGGALTRWSLAAGQALTRGGFLFALTQFFPMLQIMSGFCAVWVLETLGYQQWQYLGSQACLGFGGGVLATLVAGTLLAAGCFVTGSVLRLITPAAWWASWRTPTNPAAEPTR